MRLAVVVLVLLIAGVAMYFYRDYRRFAEAPLPQLVETTAIDVPLGTPVSGVVRILDQHGIAAGNPWYWRLLARELGVAGRLHAGEYALTPGLTPIALLKKMAAGDVMQHHFTIVEGWTFRQLRAALTQDDGLQQTLATIDDAEIMRRLRAGSCRRPTATSKA